MYRLIFSTTDPGQAKRLVTAAKKLPGVQLDHQGPVEVGISVPARRRRARQIYQDYAKGLLGREIAQRHGVSTQTVSRIATDPARYGINKPPIRRKGKA
jgi:hypothetical protein